MYIFFRYEKYIFELFYFIAFVEKCYSGFVSFDEEIGRAVQWVRDKEFIANYNQKEYFMSNNLSITPEEER